ncbi:TPA: hypothetical protein ACH3X3_002865 [Trebouxia sp. C0006]
MDVFKKGVAVSTWQCAPDKGLSNWSQWAKSRWPLQWFGMKRVKDSIDDTPDFWNRYKEDIENARKLGCNSFRLSLEWARIEPRQGYIDEDAVKRFLEIFECLEQNKMEPSVSIHHFVHPQWFEELGGWTKEENIELYVKFAVDAFKRFGKHAKLWSSFNEPTALATGGYVAGNFPPGKMFNFSLAGQVLMNLLKAHCKAYTAIKALPNASGTKFGLTHAMWKFRPAGKGLLYLPAKWACGWGTYCMGWDVVQNWMLTGHFEWSVPLRGVVHTWQHKGGKPPMDWWGIQYYSRPTVNWAMQPTCPKGEIMSLMPYASDPEGLYECIQRSSEFGIPIYVSETGFPTFNDDHMQTVLDRYLKEILRAIGDGMDCRGYYIWTLVDNFEWAEGYTKPFGMYAWRPDGSKDRELKEGAKIFIRFNNLLPDSYEAVKAIARGAVFKQKPTFADVLENAAATVGPGGHWDKAMA